MKGTMKDTGAGGGWALTGTVGGRPVRFHLLPGANRVGSTAGNQVTIVVRGISRHHATIEVGRAGVVVEDHDSKNGTFLDGDRIRRAAVDAGCALRFGPLELRLERLAREETQLGISLEPADGPQPPADDSDPDATPAAETTWLGSGRSGAPRPGSGRAPSAGEGVHRLVLPAGHLAGVSPAMDSLYAQLALLAGGDISVLLLGETGVGKEHVAKILHASSPRAARPLVAVNCAAIPSEQLEAELFGVAPGAATGVRERPGTFRRADGGTLFLDEIGELPQPVQAKLLRALQEGEIQPLGGPPETVDVRVVAATNRDLRRSMDSGDFRADLYFRLAGYTLLVPPLRQRHEDLPNLVEHFLRRESETLGKRVRGVTVKALDALVRHPWPGNVRELEQEIRRLVYLCPDGQPIDHPQLAEPIQAGIAAPPGEAGGGLPEPGGDDLDLARHEKRLIERALAASGGVLTEAARRLGISRDALRRRLIRHGLREDGV